VLVGVGHADAVTLEHRLLHAALKQPRPWYKPGSDADGALESSDDYVRRVATSVRALSDVTLGYDSKGRARTVPPDWRWGRKTLVAAVLAHWYEESRFALEVHAGTKHPVWTQDVGKAKCLGQLQVGLVPTHEWERLAGIDYESSKRCAIWTARALTRMALHCGRRKSNFQDILFPMFNGLTGLGCKPTVSGRDKVERFLTIWKAMERAPAPANESGAAPTGWLFLPASALNESTCYHLTAVPLRLWAAA